jgi:diguanylate cyclase (GGDEF)-like protein
MVDMNDLKRINDEYGHKMGDTYIIGCCHLACETFKHSPIFRIGGDEFVVLVQGTDYERRHDLVATLKENYKKASENFNAVPWERYSAAVGMGELASDDLTLELVFKRADKAMYEDKKNCKGQNGSYR